VPPGRSGDILSPQPDISRQDAFEQSLVIIVVFEITIGGKFIRLS